MATTWFISRDGQQHGPITDVEFRKLVELGHLRETDYVWHEGAPDWMPAVQFLDPAPLIARPRPARPEGAGEVGSRARADEAGFTGRHRLLVIAVSVLLAVLVAAAAMFAIQRALGAGFRPPAVERSSSRSSPTQGETVAPAKVAAAGPLAARPAPPSASVASVRPVAQGNREGP
jgi:hypothetical protein